MLQLLSATATECLIWKDDLFWFQFAFWYEMYQIVVQVYTGTNNPLYTRVYLYIINVKVYTLYIRTIMSCTNRRCMFTNSASFKAQKTQNTKTYLRKHFSVPYSQPLFISVAVVKYWRLLSLCLIMIDEPFTWMWKCCLPVVVLC